MKKNEVRHKIDDNINKLPINPKAVASVLEKLKTNSFENWDSVNQIINIDSIFTSRLFMEVKEIKERKNIKSIKEALSFLGREKLIPIIEKLIVNNVLLESIVPKLDFIYNYYWVLSISVATSTEIIANEIFGKSDSSDYYVNGILEFLGIFLLLGIDKDSYIENIHNKLEYNSTNLLEKNRKTLEIENYGVSQYELGLEFANLWAIPQKYWNGMKTLKIDSIGKEDIDLKIYLSGNCLGKYLVPHHPVFDDNLLEVTKTNKKG